MWGIMSIPPLIFLASLSAFTYFRYQALRSSRSRILFYALVVCLTTGSSMALPLFLSLVF